MPGRLDEGITELRESLRINPNGRNAEAIKRSLDLALDAKNKGKK